MPLEPADASLAVVPKSQTIASEILRLAREGDVPLRPDPALAESLATLDIGRSVPPELFRAVAEVLGFLQEMNGK